MIWRLRSGSSRINSLAVAADLVSLRVRTTCIDFRDNLMWQTAPSSSRSHRNNNSRVRIVLKLPRQVQEGNAPMKNNTPIPPMHQTTTDVLYVVIQDTFLTAVLRKWLKALRDRQAIRR